MLRQSQSIGAFVSCAVRTHWISQTTNAHMVGQPQLAAIKYLCSALTPRARIVQIGHGRRTFEQAKQELQKWGQFQLDWANVDSNTSLKKGSFVCVEAQPIPMLPVWTAVPLKMMCVLCTLPTVYAQWLQTNVISTCTETLLSRGANYLTVA